MYIQVNEGLAYMQFMATMPGVQYGNGDDLATLSWNPLCFGKCEGNQLLES